MSDFGKLNVVKVRKNVSSESSFDRSNNTDVEVSPEVQQVIREETCQLLELLIRRMVPDENEVSVSYFKGERTTVYKVDCSKNNFSYILGKQGKTIDALRKVISTITIRNGFRSVIEIPYF
ncbi:KH domain-containing protein [Bdellovibrio sp.]|uniref:KH domain-containing protein n=1 Tax=Bdellovibrio sp. TaxID=28201 RepID=UPI0039E6E91B